MGYTVQTTTDTFTNLYEARLETCKSFCPASALFYYNNGSDHGVRIEAPSIMREFVDEIPFGRGKSHTLKLFDIDLKGTFFFQNVGDFKSKTVHFNVFYNTGTDVDQRAAVVQLFVKTQGSFFAEFGGKDFGRTMSYLLDSRTGNWGVLNIGNANARVEKDTSEATITITIDAIDRQIFFVPDNYAHTPIDVWGTILFKQLKNIPVNLRSVVNYNNDRILFYPANGQTDLTAVFVPI